VSIEIKAFSDRRSDIGKMKRTKICNNEYIRDGVGDGHKDKLTV
jgi:hypothetical protein